ncbi:porin [Hwanghaeella grinnelliae]|uniref:Porin n=1 Tax=Hwanghaeella grinnelliae TaxID=2500179 RepID=A0A3S2Y2L5_9PROT|nr:porin [Hwanghaeella grinnelliae]RVU36250.1 porin [Hwanghaeella grinnelliae]
MKKTLLATSALIGASVLAAGAANAGEAPVVSFSGALAYEYIFTDNENRAAEGHDGHVITANEQQSELVWDARGTADNGLEYGANIQWRWARADHNFDEAYLDFRGSWGRMFLGAEDGVDGLIVPDVNGIQVGTWGTDGNGAARAETTMDVIGVSTASGYYHDPAHYAGDSNKIGYLTPSFGGFQAGVSFAPDTGDEFQANFAKGSAHNVTELAAAYNGEFSGVGFGIGGSYGFGDANGSGTGTASGVAIEDIEAWRIGASVSVAGFSFAADYLDNGDSSCNATSATCDAGDGWSVGAAYSFGPAAVSAAWQTFDQTLNNGADVELDVFHAGLNYQVAEGLSARINGYHLSGESTAVANDPDSTVVIVGTRVTF